MCLLKENNKRMEKFAVEVEEELLALMPRRSKWVRLGG